MECLENQVYKKIKANWDSIAKPLDSLGKFEDIICQLGEIQQSIHPDVSKSVVLVLCGDNGIVEEKISQSDQSVTRICAENIAAGKTTVGIMANQTGADVIAVDLGINCDDNLSGVLNKKIRNGTRNFFKEPAMTLEETEQAIKIGMELVEILKNKNYKIICIGEMGIGNTTTSSAIAASLLKLNAKEVTGRGAGLDDIGLSRKVYVINEAIKKYNLYNSDAMTILKTVGGFDIAGMVGVYMAAKKYRIPVILDGAISMVALLVAEKLEPGVKDFVIASHKSREPLVKKIMEELNLNPVIDGNMALGEGTGAALMLGLIKTVCAVYEKSVPFADSGVEQYNRFENV